MDNIQSLWIGDSLSRMENACIKSFLNLGYKFHLYTYDKVDNVPFGTIILDANEIIPKERIFRYSGSLVIGGGSYAGFSDCFRFKLLKDRGGTWVDTDFYCLKRLPESEYLFVQERDKVASCIFRCPRGCEFAVRCDKICQSKIPNKIKWGEIGPELFIQVINDLKLKDHIRPENFCFPFLWGDVKNFLLPGNLDDKLFGIHLWHEFWRRKGQDKTKVYRQDCLYEKLIQRANQIKLI